MAWSKPEIQEVECGMEVNMYSPEQDDQERETFV
ncbi:MAG: pyrroloquinoline quinone precursor peptide PqqA [Pseudomonadota bacterium]